MVINYIFGSFLYIVTIASIRAFQSLFLYRKPNTDIKYIWNQGSDLKNKFIMYKNVTILNNYCQVYKYISLVYGWEYQYKETTLILLQTNVGKVIQI